MGTRSSIGIKNANGTVTAIYCHWDGYPSHNGKILNKYYDRSKAVTLLEHGDMSSLGRDIGTKHAFGDIVEGECTFYARDRGEKGVEARTFASADDYYENFESGIEYCYLLVDDRWLVRSIWDDQGWEPVTEVLAKEEEHA
jgi:hypothetical protein